MEKESLTNIKLRKATEDDLPLMMAWRSNPDIYQGFYIQKKPLEWGEHLAWFRTRNSNWRTLIVLYEERPVGVITIEQLDHWSPEIGYYIGETSLWGKGVGTEAVKLTLDIIRGYGKEYVRADILDSNSRSIGIVTTLGFERLGSTREGGSWYQKKL